ncbi:peptidoglycan-binding domain-containing protein [Mycobacterium sp. LTG2003]
MYGSGNTIGVYGKTVSGGIVRVAGVYGQDNSGQIGVLGAVMSGGTAVAGVNVSSLGNPLSSFDNLPNPGSGSGTGVFGTSGSGTGVHGTSNTGFGLHGVSESNTAVVASSTSGIGVHGISASNTGTVGDSTSGWGVHGISETNTAVVGFSTSGFGLHGDSKSNTAVVGTSETGIGVHGIGKGPGEGVRGSSTNGNGGVFDSEQAAPIRLLPRNIESPEGQMKGIGGELLVTMSTSESGENLALWFCIRGGDAVSALWELVAGARPFPGTPVAEGALGVTVKRIQRQLNLVAASGLFSDGVFGPLTKQAVIDFQTAEQVSADGIVGPTTWSRLFAVI